MKKIIAIMVLFSIFFTLGCGSNASSSEPLIIAHRGASGVAPENTVASVKLAFEKEADGSEIDVYLTKDNRIMALHDKTTKKTTGVDLKITESASQQLRRLDAGSWKSSEYAGEKIPFIEEIFEVVPKGKKLFVEIKDDMDIVPHLVKSVKESGKIDRMVFIAFDGDVLAECKRLLPQVPMYWLKSSSKDKDTGEYLPYDESVIQYALENGFEGVDLRYLGLTKDFVEKANAAGLEVHVWTVNEPKDAEYVAECGVSSITTDYPDVIREALRL